MWELVAFSTEDHGERAVRSRRYTTSATKAKAFERIPRIDFSDSGHGIVFMSRPCAGRSKDRPEKRGQDEHIAKHLPALWREEKARV